MTLHYLDSSAWVKRYCLETGSEWIGDFFAQAPAVVCSALGMIEVLSTLARKKKAHELGLEAFREKSREAERDFGLFHRIYLTPELLDLASSLARERALRGADTVHLASACFLRDRIGDGETEVRMITCDGELLAAARNCGFSVINPEDEVQPSE